MPADNRFLFVAETTDIAATLTAIRLRDAASADISLRRTDDGAVVELLSPAGIDRRAALTVGRALARLPGSRLVKVVAVRRANGSRFARTEVARWEAGPALRQAA